MLTPAARRARRRPMLSPGITSKTPLVCKAKRPKVNFIASRGRSNYDGNLDFYWPVDELQRPVVHVSPFDYEFDPRRARIQVVHGYSRLGIKIEVFIIQPILIQLI